MAKEKQYDLFISHTWQFSENYYRLENLLRKTDLIRWRNYSVPVDDPLVDPDSSVGKAYLTELLTRQVKPANCVLIIGDHHTARSEWVVKEIEIARLYHKPILGVYPRGKKTIPSIVKNAAHELAGWNTASIVNAIKRIAI